MRFLIGVMVTFCHRLRHHQDDGNNHGPGADPGFPVEGGANPSGRGANIRFCQIF